MKHTPCKNGLRPLGVSKKSVRKMSAYSRKLHKEVKK